jgi:hypothetical protein
VLLLDERGRPLFVNRAAEALLTEGDGLTLRRGRLHAATGAASARLQAAIATALATRDGRGPGPDGALVLPDDVQFERPSGRLKG